MRLLPSRPDHVGHGVAGQQPPARRFGHRRCHGGRSLPLRDLYPHPPGDQERRSQISLNMKKIVGIVVAVVIVIALGFAGWLFLGRDPMSFAGGSTVALADYQGADITGVPPQLASADLVKRGEYLTPA